MTKCEEDLKIALLSVFLKCIKVFSSIHASVCLLNTLETCISSVVAKELKCYVVTTKSKSHEPEKR